ncbi:fluoride efflux transporter CrcB [Alteromonas lipotrueiana]|uniref:fluoride efflux transporter CrcB n=1 Tax=Alteromonas lipotrueiana TaxID=2803815 RepID=UPI001C487FD5|nr:fluoride efflux transporter CrcB [Alteromonas lipotrueiana]
MSATVVLYGYIAAGGALGACLRYFLTSQVDSWFGKSLPFGTLAVNILGSFCLALVYGLFERQELAETPYRAFIAVGLLGALTTFSTFSIDTLALLQSGLWMKAALNVIFNVGICLLAGGLAMTIIKG